MQHHPRCPAYGNPKWDDVDECGPCEHLAKGPRIGSLFSGYGGLDLAVMQVLGGDIAWHVEYDKAPSRILDHHWPDVPNYGDVTKLDFTTVEPVDVLTGGYPCQPFSHAGMRKGTNDERHLWPHVLRAIRDLGFAPTISGQFWAAPNVRCQ